MSHKRDNQDKHKSSNTKNIKEDQRIGGSSRITSEEDEPNESVVTAVGLVFGISRDDDNDSPAKNTANILHNPPQSSSKSRGTVQSVNEKQSTALFSVSQQLLNTLQSSNDENVKGGSKGMKESEKPAGKFPHQQPVNKGQHFKQTISKQVHSEPPNTEEEVENESIGTAVGYYLGISRGDDSYSNQSESTNQLTVDGKRGAPERVEKGQVANQDTGQQSTSLDSKQWKHQAMKIPEVPRRLKQGEHDREANQEESVVTTVGKFLGIIREKSSRNQKFDDNENDERIVRANENVARKSSLTGKTVTPKEAFSSRNPENDSRESSTTLTSNHSQSTPTIVVQPQSAANTKQLLLPQQTEYPTTSNVSEAPDSKQNNPVLVPKSNRTGTVPQQPLTDNEENSNSSKVLVSEERNKQTQPPTLPVREPVEYEITSNSNENMGLNFPVGLDGARRRKIVEQKVHDEASVSVGGSSRQLKLSERTVEDIHKATDSNAIFTPVVISKKPESPIANEVHPKLAHEDQNVNETKEHYTPIMVPKPTESSKSVPPPSLAHSSINLETSKATTRDVGPHEAQESEKASHIDKEPHDKTALTPPVIPERQEPTKASTYETSQENVHEDQKLNSYKEQLAVAPKKSEPTSAAASKEVKQADQSVSETNTVQDSKPSLVIPPKKIVPILQAQENQKLSDNNRVSGTQPSPIAVAVPKDQQPTVLSTIEVPRQLRHDDRTTIDSNNKASDSMPTTSSDVASKPLPITTANVADISEQFKIGKNTNEPRRVPDLKSSQSSSAVNKLPQSTVANSARPKQESRTQSETGGASQERGTHGSRTEVAGPAVTIRRSETTSYTPRQCWICLINDEDEPGLKWIQPCKCKGTTKWVHQKCLLLWVDEKLKERRGRKVACPQCKTEYLVHLPNANLLIRSLDKIDNVIYRVCPFIAAGVVIGTLYWNAVTYGALVVVQVGGAEGVRQAMDTFQPAAILVGLPFVPLSLIVFRLYQWEDSFLHFLRTNSRCLPVLNYILPTHVVNESGQLIEVLQESISLQRVLAGALLTPIIAKISGNLIFGSVSSPVYRTFLGGAAFVGVKGMIKLYYKQQTYKRLSRRRILDYTEENRRLIAASQLFVHQVTTSPLRFHFIATIDDHDGHRQ